jgi:very-short-patch-repair endonuclease
MPGEWREVALWDIAEYINGRATKPSELASNGVPVIKIAELNRGITEETDRIPPELVEEKHWVSPGDLLFAWSGSVGIYRYTGPKAALNQHIFRVVAKPGIDQDFLRYLLLSCVPLFQLHVQDKRTTMGHVTKKDLQRIRVRIPPLQEQRAIAHILGTLDDKIELNRRMSETLEAMARALFKAWFVDFEPVRAKMEGRWQRGNPLPPLPEGEGRGEGSLPTKSHTRLPSDLLAFARELRQNETDAERLLWRLLRNRSLAGAKFRRQHPFPPYVLDFYCHELKLAIELDGGQHNLPEGRLHDKVRTANWRSTESASFVFGITRCCATPRAC